MEQELNKTTTHPPLPSLSPDQSTWTWNRKPDEDAVELGEKATINEIQESILRIKEPFLKTINCLDKGFVRLVDWMGSDQRIVQAARVSYGSGTKSVREDAGLIDYLMRHAHTSPFEQVSFTFHVKMPIFVARQIVRHRTACLSGDTKLWFDEPAAISKGKRKRSSLSIKEFNDKWHNGATSVYNPKRKDCCLEKIDLEKYYTVPQLAELINRTDEHVRGWLINGNLKGHKVKINSITDCSWRILGKDWADFSKKQKYWHNDLKCILSKRNLRMCDENTGEILHTHIKDVWSNGIKDVFKITLENGYTIKMTKDHLCFSDAGWGTLENLSNLKIGENFNCSWSSEAPSFCVNGVLAYQDYNWMKQKREEGHDVQSIADSAGCSYHTIRKWIKIHNLKFSAKEKSKFSGLKQRGTKRTKGNHKVTEEMKEKIRQARSGEKSNFWKGGTSTERESIARWITQISPSVHKKYNYTCQICDCKKKLHAHHINPVWNSLSLSKSFDNLISLCQDCHRFLHSNNLELKFLEFFNENKPLSLLREEVKHKRQYITGHKKLVRGYSKIKNIEYAGKEEVFDIEVDGPFHNFVANGFIVHNSLNEVSGRYSVMKDEFYVPSLERMQKQSEENKQGSSDELIDDALGHIQQMNNEHTFTYRNYEDYLASGMARELARINLPLSLMTEWYWKIDLLNLFKFLSLRLDAHAQYEVRVIAQAKYDLIKPIVPLACESFQRHMINGRRFSEDEMNIIKELIQHIDLENFVQEKKWKKSKIDEFTQKIK